jgi:ADP-glucose pyrophosphorylase
MATLEYYWSKILKKLRGRAVKNSTIHKTSMIESGSQVVNCTMDKHSFCGYDCQIVNCDIGSFCSISNNVVIGGGRHPGVGSHVTCVL